MDPNDRKSPARARTLRRMHLLVGGAAAWGTACSSPHDSTGGVTASPPPSNATGQGTASSPTATAMRSSGYVVVDALPPPARCSIDAASEVAAKATWRTRTDGKHEIALHVEPPPRGVRYGEGPFEVMGGESPAASSVFPNDALELRSVVTEPTGGQLGFALPVSCGTERGVVEITVSWDKQATAPDAPLTVNLQARPGSFH